MKQILQVCVSVGVGLVVGYALAFLRIHDRADIAPGSEIVSTPPEMIMFVSYTSEASTLTAQRSKPGAAFVVQATFADGRPAQHCTVSSDLAGQLGIYSKLVAKREVSLEEREKEFPIPLGVLDVRSYAIGDTDYPMLVFTNKSQSSVAFVLDRYAAELTFPLEALRKLDAGCAAFELR